MKRKVMLLMVCLFAWVGVALAQKTVSGTVVSSADGEPVIGASVIVSGTKVGTSTDVNGKFTINNVPNSAKTLRVSYLGMVTKEVAIKPNLRISLDNDDTNLEEVVVVAYGTAKKSSLTGAVNSVDSKLIEKNIGTSVTGALEGSAPGVQVNNTYGEPGSDPTIRIRGFGSVNGSNAPLYILDGVVYNGNISDLNSNDIESMTVLKDASAAALYGNRAANGVIIITTKRAKMSNKPQVTLTTNHGAYTRGIKEYDRLGADKWMEVQWEGLKNYSLTNELARTQAEAAAYASKNLIADLVKNNIYDKGNTELFDANGKLVANQLPGYTDLDWQDAIIRNGYRQEYGINFTNSNDKYNVFASAGYLKENGYIITTDFERYNARVNANFTPTKWFKGGVNLAATSQTQNYNSSAYSSYYANPFYTTRYEAPVYPIYSHNADGSIVLDTEGNPVYDTTSSWRSNRHIIYELNNDNEKNRRQTIEATIYATFVLPYGFDFTVKGNKYLTSRARTKYNNSSIGDGAANNGRLSNYNYNYSTTNFQQQLNWSHDYGKHHVDALFAHESYKYEYSNVYGMNTGMSVAGNYTMTNFTTNSYYYGYEDTDATESYLARARYNFAEKYYGEASFRRDGSSRFSKDSRWGNFWSVGGAWDFSKEDFVKDLGWLNYGKLRVSLGQVGNNQGIDYYAYQALYNLDKNAGNGSLVKQQLSANDLKWETTQTFDIGVDARLFDRLNLSIGYFDKYSKDLLFSVKLPASAGAFYGESANMTQLQNIGNVSNRGWEISADVDIVKTKDWKWNFGADATFIKNKIKTLPNHEEIANGTKRFAEGHSMYEFYTYHFVGVDQLTGNSLYTLDPEKKEACQTAGKLVTINGVDYTTDTTHGLKDWAGSALPNVYGSFHTNVSWKDLSLSVLMTYSLGGKLLDGEYQDLMSTSSASAKAQHSDILNSWKAAPEGMTEDSPNRILAGGLPSINHALSTYNNATSDRWLTSASYLVMKNITLSYNIPSTLVKGWGLEAVSVKAGVENLFTLTSRQGINPQYSFTGTQDATYATARIFNVGATIKF